jgi:hypothetical protein
MWLKQSTAYTFRLGPFVDSTDGFTPETGLTIGDTDCFLSKNGAAFAAKNETTDLTGTGDARGYYTCVMNTTDTATLGALRVHVYVAGALPVWQDFMVVPASSYDALVSGSVGVTIKTVMKKNQALNAFAFLMTDSTNHNPATGKTVTVTRSIDGGAFGAGTIGSVTEVSNGIYEVDLGAGDRNGDVVVYRMTATACDDLFVTHLLEP